MNAPVEEKKQISDLAGLKSLHWKKQKRYKSEKRWSSIKRTFHRGLQIWGGATVWRILAQATTKGEGGKLDPRRQQIKKTQKKGKKVGGYSGLTKTSLDVPQNKNSAEMAKQEDKGGD